MYKVFFNERTLYLTDEFSKNFQKHFGLFFKHRDLEELKEIIEIYNKVSKINSLIVFHWDIEQLREDFRSCFIQINAAGGVVRNKQGEYLFIHRRGKWDLPKGKLDQHESFQQAAIREVSEEAGLTGLSLRRSLMSTYHTYPYKNELALKKTYWFEMEYSGDETPSPQTEEDITEVRWFKAGELDEIPFKNTYGLIIDLFNYLGL